ncbi:MAG: type II toxin-antitoxin system HigB family toxin [Acidobacteriota bacterium]
MIILGRDKLYQFGQAHADARNWISSWIAEVEDANWRTPQDIKRRYSSASFLPENRVIINVKGNSYRLEVQVAFKTGTVVVKHIETHAEYTKRCG